MRKLMGEVLEGGLVGHGPVDFQRLVFLDRVHISIHESACL